MNLRNLIQKSVDELRKSVIPTPELDVQVLLGHVTEKDNTFVYAHPEHLITNAQYSKFRRLIRRRRKGEPVAYLTGHKEFYGYDFIVNKNVLVPRPETEYLVEEGINFIKNHSTDDSQQLTILDMGTGSGCIIVSLINQLLSTNYQLPINFCASEVSKEAITVARKNAEKFEVKRLIHFYLSDLLGNPRMPKEYDLILANLPYVPKSDEKNKQKNGILFEPENSIFANKGGGSIIENFLCQSNKRLKKQGRIILELDPRNANMLWSIAKKNFPNDKVEIEKDLSGKNRYLIVQK